VCGRVLLTDLQFRLHYPNDGSVLARFYRANTEGILLASVIVFTQEAACFGYWLS
jgi:hypothetical protein